MRLASFIHAGRAGFGVVDDDGIIDLSGTPDPASPGNPGSLRQFLAAGGRVDGAVTADAPRIGLSEITFLPVIPDPGLILCVGHNYARHVAEMGREMPAHPAIFSRTPRSQIGHGADMIRPRVSDRLDFEGELAVIIGRGGRHIREADALDHVAGYACYNDGSIRDWQRHTSQFLPGKNFHGTGAFGPWMVTPDEVGGVPGAPIETRLNGETMQASSTDDLIFGVPALIAYISTFTPLEPGDVVVTGTPGGVGVARTPPVFMKPGDRVEVEIGGIGILANRIVDEAETRVDGSPGAGTWEAGR